MSANKVVFETVRPWLDSKGFTPERIAALDRAIAERVAGTAATIPAPRPSHGLGRRVSPAGVALMHHFEQCRLEAYPDPGSADGHPWTIGWGATGAGIGPGVKWTQAQADARFASDLAMFEDGVTRLLAGAPTTQSQFDALVSLAYNIGLDEDADTIAEGLGDSSLLRKHKAGDYEGAARGFIAWRFNDGREMRGLKRRREAEAKHYRGG